MHPTLNTFKILLLALVLAGGLQYAIAAWGGPTAMPPGNNAAAPINVSGAYQEKEGALYVWAGGVFSGNGVWALGDGVRATQYCDENGENCTDGAEVGGGGITWLHPPERVLDDSSLSVRRWETLTLSQVPANGTAILRVHSTIPVSGEDEHHVYIRRKGSSYDGELVGYDWRYNYAPDHIRSQVMVEVNENSQIEYRLGDRPIRIRIDLLGYME